MINFIWPIALVVCSNVVYQIAAKTTPADINPLASLTVTYFLAALVSAILYYALNKGGNLFSEYTKLNWSSFALGIVIVGLEVGFIYAYKAGWQVSTASIVQSAVLAVVLIFVGYFLYHESLSLKKILGILICLTGLYFINQ